MTEPVNNLFNFKPCNPKLCYFIVTFDNTITKLRIISDKTSYYFACGKVIPSGDLCKVLEND
jgi:hypothetical protein